MTYLPDFKFSIFSRLLVALLAFLGAASFSFAASTLPQQVWVVVTHPVLSCGAVDDDLAIRAKMLALVAHPATDGKLSDGCAVLKVGARYLLDDEQTEAETKIAVKMWAPVCPKGCVPSMTVVYAPPRSLAGVYLRPTTPPKGW